MGVNLRKLFHPVKHVLPGHCTNLKASPVPALLVIIIFINDFRLLKDTESAVQRMHLSKLKRKVQPSLLRKTPSLQMLPDLKLRLLYLSQKGI